MSGRAIAVGVAAGISNALLGDPRGDAAAGGTCFAAGTAFAAAGAATDDAPGGSVGRGLKAEDGDERSDADGDGASARCPMRKVKSELVEVLTIHPNFLLWFDRHTWPDLAGPRLCRESRNNPGFDRPNERSPRGNQFCLQM